MIIHVFNAKMYHLSPGIIMGLLKNFRDTIGAIVLLEDGAVERGKYESIFEEYDFKDFVFCPSKFYYMVKAFQNYRSFPVLFHGGSYERWSAAFKAGCKNVNWICWGGDASKSSARRKSQYFIKRIIGRIYDLWSFQKKKRLYQKFHSIVALIAPDRQTIVNDFNIPTDRVYVIPYRYNREIASKDLIDELYYTSGTINKDKPLVLIGNSPINVPFYMQMIELLKNFSGRIEVHCMYQYPHKKDEAFMSLHQLGVEYFGNDFFIDEEFMTDEDYLRYLNLTDIYVCSNPEQTGIGAINRFLLLGKKMYLTGKNYEYVLGLGCYVHNTKDISGTEIENFVRPDSQEIRKRNRDALKEMHSNAFDKWVSYFKQIDS